MALIYTDGFDYSTTVAGINSRYSTSTLATITTGRTGINAAQLDSARSMISKFFTVSGNSFVLGLAIYFTSMPNGDVIYIQTSGTSQLKLNINTAGNILVKRGSTTLATSSTTLSTGSWYYLEFKGTIHTSAGAYEVRVDGSTFGGLTGSGVNTADAGTNVWNNFRFDGTTGLKLDDLYLLDQSGSDNNDFLGDSKVECLLPQTDAVAAGTHADFTPSTGTDHGALVDEGAPNGNTDYNSSAVVGDIDSYNYPALSLTGTIRGVQVAAYHSKTDAGARTVSVMTRVASTDYVHATAISPTTSYTYDTQVFETNPNSGVAWVSADVNGAEFGLKIIS